MNATGDDITAIIGTLVSVVAIGGFPADTD